MSDLEAGPAEAAGEDSPRRSVERLLALAEELPENLRADWRDTNHYELTSEHEEGYWWLILFDVLPSDVESPCDTQRGRRLGLLLDLAEEVKRSAPHLRTLLDDE